MIEVHVIRAWPRQHEACRLQLPQGATVGDALSATGWTRHLDEVGTAIFGLRCAVDQVLHHGDRVELLRPLVADPKDARRRRASAT